MNHSIKWVRTELLSYLLQLCLEVHATCQHRIAYYMCQNKPCKYDSNSTNYIFVLTNHVLYLSARKYSSDTPLYFRCLDSIIGEQLKKIRHSLADILTLDTAAASATDRLSVVRASMRNGTNKSRKVLLPPKCSDECCELNLESKEETFMISFEYNKNVQ